MMTRVCRMKTSLVGALLLSVLAGPAAAEPPKGSITIDRIASIKFPTLPGWSPDGSTVAFLWDAAGKQDLFVVRPGGSPVALTDFPLNPNLQQSDIGQWEWASADRILFLKDSQLWSVSVSAPKPARVLGIEADAAFSLSRDGKQIAYVRQGQILWSSLAAPFPQTLTQLTDPLRATSVRLSRDSRFVAFNASRAWTEFEPLPFNGTRIRSMRSMTADRKLGIVSVHGGEPMWIPTMGDAVVVDWTAEGTLVFEEMSPDRKTRSIKVAAVDGTVRTLWSDYDPAWWSPTRGPLTVVSPNGQQVAFFSDKTGWTHLYVAPLAAAATAKARQLTSGNFTVGYPAWSPDSKRLAYGHGLPGNQMERLLSIVDIETGRSEPVVTSHGVQITPDFSPDGTTLLYQRSAIEHSLDLYAIALTAGAQPVRLTDSMPAGLDAADLTTPVLVDFPSRVDGKKVPASLLVSKNLDRTKKHPAIVWIHGSGSDQNYLGWHPALYRMYYAMHQYLAQQGYVIIMPDYRGSSGYDREWATGNYLDLGGKDLLDVASGADYLKTLDYVDPDRIGVWGLSYGGFMTLQAVTVTPTLFRCAIDVAGVTDWAPRPGGWTVARLGTPAEHPAEFDASAPVKHMDKLVRPLLILHGTNDTNVAFHDTLSLVDTLAKLGKPFEMSIYPGEPHFFRRAYVLRDAWRRAEEFFDKHLKADDRAVLE
ncbi:MAG: prolyl oligopeptidase family serine peptidase [Acidobacteriota bacterium]